MSRPKPGIGRELRRTFGHAKVHSQSSSSSAVQLAPVVSHYVASSRSTSTSTSASASTSTPTSDIVQESIIPTGQFSHLALIPTWDAIDSLIPTTGLREAGIVIPYRPGPGLGRGRGRRSLPPPHPHPSIPIQPQRHAAVVARAGGGLLAPRPVRIGDTLLRRQEHRTYTSSTAPVHHSAMDMQMPFPNLFIPPSILTDPCTSNSNGATTINSNSNHSSTWPFDFLWSSSPQNPPTEQEVGLVPQHPPSPGPGTVKTREIPETHTVLSPSTPALQQTSSPSHALLTHYALRLPNDQTVQTTLPSPPDSEAGMTYSSSLEFRIGASGLAKVRPPPTPPRAGSSSRERPPPPRTFVLADVEAPVTLSSEQVGEDAYFTRPDSMCIADGVGGWAHSGRGGANAARWSRLLTHFIKEEIDLWWKGDSIYIESTPTTGKGKRSWSEKWRDSKTKEDDGIGLEPGMRRRKLDAVEIMQRGFEKCLSCVMSEGIRGSSTCILALLYHSTLLLANLGDCALLLIRNGEVILRTSEMQHAFNHPLQVGTHSRDEPMKDAMSWSVPVEREDVVVLGSDGLMDNLYDEDILDVLATFAPPHSPSSSHPTSSSSASTKGSSLPKFDPQSVSDALCARAREISEQTGATSPFMERAIEEGIDFVGGKKDDITVIVGVVGQRGL